MNKQDTHHKPARDRLEDFWYRRGYSDASQGRPNVAERVDFAKNQGEQAQHAYASGYRAGLHHTRTPAA